MKKKHVIVPSLSIIAGLVISMAGSFFWVTAKAETGNFDPNQVVGISLSQGRVFANTLNIGNIVPGDSATDSIEITNTGSQSEYLTIQHFLQGDIFQDNGKTGTSLGVATGSDGVLHGISMDYSRTNDNPEFKFDDYPLEMSYQIHLARLLGEQIVSQGPFSTNNTSPTFQLDAGQSAYVTYSYKMPIQAHNDYQATCGRMELIVNAESDVPPSSGGGSTGGSTGGTPPGSPFGGTVGVTTPSGPNSTPSKTPGTTKPSKTKPGKTKSGTKPGTKPSSKPGSKPVTKPSKKPGSPSASKPGTQPGQTGESEFNINPNSKPGTDVTPGSGSFSTASSTSQQPEDPNSVNESDGSRTPPEHSTDVIPGGTEPVTGLQVGVILAVGLALMVLGCGLIIFRRESKK